VKIKIKIRLTVRKREEKLFKKQFNIKELENPEIAKNFRKYCTKHTTTKGKNGR